MKRAAILLLLLSAPLWAAPPKLVIPAEVRPAGQYVDLLPDTDAVSVQYVGLSGVEPIPARWLSDKRVFLLDTRGLPVGRYRFAAVAAAKDGDQARRDFEVVVGDAPPTPPVPPGPTPPGPTPPAPATGLRVLVVEESADRPKLPAAQQSVLFSKQVRDWLNANCSDWPEGKIKDWGIMDQHVDLSEYSKHLRDMMARPRTSLPWVVIKGNGSVVHEGPLPADVPAMLALLAKHTPKKKGG